MVNSFYAGSCSTKIHDLDSIFAHLGSFILQSTSLAALLNWLTDASEVFDNGECFDMSDIADDSRVGLDGITIDSPDSRVNGDMSRDHAALDRFWLESPECTAGFLRNKNLVVSNWTEPMTAQPCDQDAACGSHSQPSNLVTNHSATNEVVVIDDAVATCTPANDVAEDDTIVRLGLCVQSSGWPGSKSSQPK